MCARIFFKLMFASLLLAFAGVSGSIAALPGGAAIASTTTLVISPGTANAGTSVALTATVTSSSLPVTHGTVTFCAAAAAHCDGAAVLGAAQLRGDGTATIKVRLGEGTYSIKAVFAGTVSILTSTSAPQSLTVSAATPNSYLTFTTLSSSGTVGNYTLTATVASFGKPPDTGTVSFVDTSNSNATVSTAPLDPLTQDFKFVAAPNSPLAAPAAQYVHVADLNNDGIPDVIIVNNNFTGSVVIYQGKGDGTFQAPSTFDTGGFPKAITTADVNGDGNLDLIVPIQTTASIGILLGNGDGTFGSMTSYSVGNTPTFVAVGDFNRDGNLDLAVTNQTDNTIGVLLGNGDGTFNPQVTYAVGGFPQGIVAGDFNNDGKVDLADTDSNGVSILLGNGDGTFTAGTSRSLPATAVGALLSAGDLRNNGTLDLVVPNAFGLNAFVLLGNNDGTFQAAVPFAASDFPQSVTLGDLNGDGILDFVIADTGADGLVTVWFGLGDGTFDGPLNLTVGDFPEDAVIADLNGDGLMDIVTANLATSNSTILLQQLIESATATGVSVSPGNHNVGAEFPGDTSHVGSASSTVVLAGPTLTATTTALTISPNPSNVGQSVTLTATITPAPSPSPFGTVQFFLGAVSLGSGAVNASGVATLAVTTLPGGAGSITAVYSGNANFAGSTSTATFAVVHPTATTTTTLGLSAATVTAGTATTLTATVQASGSPVTSGTVTFCNANATSCTGLAVLGTMQLKSNGTAILKMTFGVGTYSIKAVFAGRNDVLGSTSTAQALTVNGTAPYASFTTLSSSGSVGNYTLDSIVAGFGTATLTGNVSFLDTSNSNASVGSAPLAGPTTYQLVPGPSSPLSDNDGPENVVAADFNGDGILDLAVVDNFTSVVNVYIGNGDGTFQDAVPYGIGNGGDDIAVGDFDGDGKLDIVATAADSVDLLRGNGDGTFQKEDTIFNGVNPVGVAVADLNHDGKLDLVIAELGTDQVVVMLGNGDGSFQLPVSYANGHGAFFTAIGDFNGDGFPDLAVAGVFGNFVSVYINNGDGTFKPAVDYSVGSSPDYVLAADFNKDGKLDLAVANFDDNTISILIGKGDGTFQNAVAYDSGDGPNDLAVMDFNHDGNLDLVVTDDNDTTISILRGNGDGTFNAPDILDVAGSGPWGIVAGDFNGDGLADLAVTNFNDATVTILLGEQTRGASITGVSIFGGTVHNVLASYPGDTSRIASQSTTVPLNGTPPAVTTTALVSNPAATAAAGQQVTLTATVTPAPTGSSLGTVSFFNGATLLGTSSLNASGVATLTFTFTTVGTAKLTAVYSGIPAFATSTSPTVGLDITPGFDVTAATTSFTVSQGGAAAIPLNLPPIGGAFNNLVTMSATGLPPGATATFVPPTVTPGAAGAPTTLTIQLKTINPTPGGVRIPRNTWPLIPGVCLVLCALFGLAKVKENTRRRWLRLAFAGAAALGVLFIAAGCNGGFNGVPITAPGSYTITVTGTSGALHPSTTVTLVVQ